MNEPLPIDPATGRRLWSKADHDSAREDAWGAVCAGVPPFGESEAELQWLEIAAEERARRAPANVVRFPGGR